MKSGVDDPDLWPFYKWSPSPENVTGNRNCYAQFNYQGVEDTITDTWAEIFSAERNGTYLVKYQVGDTKILDMGDAGRIAMQIVAFDSDDMADGSGKAPITWVSQQLLNDTARYNPAGLVRNYETITNPGWIQDTDGNWISNNKGIHSTDATETWTLTVTRAGTITVGAKVSSESGFDKLTVTVGAETLVDAISGSTSLAETSIDVEVGDTVTVTALYHKDGSVDKNSDCGTVVFGGVAEYTIEAAGTTYSYQKLVSYNANTGTVGGWEASELREMVRALREYIPANVMSNILEVTKTQYYYSADPTVYGTQTTTDDLWVPSSTEVLNSGAYTEVFADNASRIKYKPGLTTATSWYLRNASSADSAYIIATSGASSTSVTSYLGVALGFCT